MKKYLILLMTAFSLSIMAFRYADSFYDLSFTSMNTDSVSLRQFKGKRVLIIVLPLSRQDSMSVTPQQIFNLAGRYKDSLMILGVPGEETGYRDSGKEQVKTLYENLPSNFILTSGMKVAKSSGQNQASLFQWLTDVKKNKFFDKDVRGTGQKFFVNRYGQLYAVLGPQLQLSNSIIDTVLSRPGSSGIH